MKIKIYCLIDTLYKRPFYVGATKRSIKTRLSSHRSELKTYKHCIESNVKWVYMTNLINNGIGIDAVLLYECNIHESDFYEYFFYQLFVHQGYEMMNYESTFYYGKKHTNTMYISKLNKRNRQLKRYDKIIFKNIVIIIW